MIEEGESLDLDYSISFFQESISFDFLSQEDIVKWIESTVASEDQSLGPVTIIFCTDEYLLEINKDHLDHDYYTDIITFQYSAKPISGDLFISIDRVRDNAAQLKTSFTDELHRVIIHGILHLCGYKDKSENDVALMRQKENHFLALRTFV